MMITVEPAILWNQLNTKTTYWISKSCRPYAEYNALLYHNSENLLVRVKTASMALTIGGLNSGVPCYQTKETISFKKKKWNENAFK